MTPDSTPREALYMETGLLPIDIVADSKRMNMKARLIRDKSDLMDKVLNNPTCMWEKDTVEVMNKYGITQGDLTGTKYQTKLRIKKAVIQYFKSHCYNLCQDRSKLKFYGDSKVDFEPLKREDYMNEMSRVQTSIIFRARVRIIKVKYNYKNGYAGNLTCRICKRETETQKHILEECTVLHNDESTKVPHHQLFNKDTDTQRKNAQKLEQILEKLSNMVC